MFLLSLVRQNCYNMACVYQQVSALQLQQCGRLSVPTAGPDKSLCCSLCRPGKIAVDPTSGDSEGENELNTKGQLTRNAGTAPSGPAMLNGQRVTSANLNQKTPSTKKATTATTATPTAATVAATPALVTATPLFASAQTTGAQTLVSSAVNHQQGQQLGRTLTPANGGSQTAAQFVQQAPSLSNARSAAVSGGSASRSGGQLSGSVTSVSGGRRMMLVVTPLRVVSPSS